MEVDSPTLEDFLSVLDLPDEVLVLILHHLPLLDLANARLVCTRLRRLIDSSSHGQLWSRASLDGMWVAPSNRAMIERAAQHGNVEALIKLAVAYLYSEGIPDGSGKGTLDSFNGKKVAEYLIEAEALTPHSQPFSWLLIRPPLATNMVCCKACVCHRIQQHCLRAENKECVRGLCFCVGKALTFHEDEEGRGEVEEWFERGEKLGCPFSAYERWKTISQPLVRKYRELSVEEVQSVRRLRRIVSTSSVSSPAECLEAKFELSKLYVRGCYGGTSRTLAFQFLRQMMASSKGLLSGCVLRAQPHLTEEMLYIVVDWLAEVSEMKEFPSATVHLAVSLTHRYMLQRPVPRTKLQLLGISALLVASRWMGLTIITMREASWLTDGTYKYEDVVRMTGELVAVLEGNMRRATIADYLELLLLLVTSDYRTACMSYYLSECALLYTDFGRYTTAQVAACCLLLSRIVLEHEYPWPAVLTEATGFTLSDLRYCTALLYDKCLTDKYAVTDHRGVRLNAVSTRYSEDRFLCISQANVISYQEVLDRLGLVPSPSPVQPRSKLFSFLSDSQYQNQSPDDSLVTSSFLDQFGTQRLTDTSLPHLPCPLELPPSPTNCVRAPPQQPLVVASSPISTGQQWRRKEQDLSLPPLANISPVSNFLSSDSDSEAEHRPASSTSLRSLPPLPLGIEPLHSEETVGFDLPLPSLKPTNRMFPKSYETADKAQRTENSRPARPLQSIENWQSLPSAVSGKSMTIEKRAPLGTQPHSSRTKRRRQANQNNW